MQLHMKGTMHINIKYRYFFPIPYSLQLTFQRAIIFSFIYHLPFNKRVFFYFPLKFLNAHEIIIYAILLIAPWFTCRSRNRKREQDIYSTNNVLLRFYRLRMVQ